MKRLQLSVTFALAACTAAVKPLPPYYTAANVDHPKYSHTKFIAGVGLSTLSAEDADTRAKANVSAQISSQVQSVMTSDQAFTSKTGDTTESVSQHTSVRTDFDRADLIRIAEREQQGDSYYSFAVLDREATDRELAAQSSADLAKFQSAAAAAMRARNQHESGVFASAATEAMHARGLLDARFVVRRAITGRAAADEHQYAEARNDLLAEIEKARANRVVGVVFSSKATGGHLGDLAINAIKRLGMRPDSTACKDRDEKTRTDATELAVEPEESCMEGPLGEKCEVVVHLVAQACSGNTSGAGTVAQVRGVHPSDRDKARKSAWDKVTQQAVQAAVRDALGSAIAIGGE